MKALLVLLAILLPASLVLGQKNCCAPHEERSFAMFAKDPAFAAAHAEPLPFPDPSDIQGTSVSFPCADGRSGNGFLVRGKDTSKILLVFHEWWGLNDYIKNEAMKFADELGVTVFALDLYDGKVATTREQATEYIQAVKPERVAALTEGAYTYFGSDRRYATIGWCAGGTWSMQAALIGTDRHLVGCVMYYGMPEREPKALDLLHCPVLGIFAKRDKFITPEIVMEAKKAFQNAKKEFLVHFYDANHGFANPSNPVYDMKNAKDANERALAFLKKRFAAK